MIGGKLYDFDLSGVTKDRWGQTMNPFLKGLDVVLAQKLQADQEQAYQQGLASLSSPKLDAEDIEVITALQGGQTPEGLASLTTPQVSQAQGGLAGLSAPQRRNFEITPEMQQRAVAIDYLTGSQPGTSMNQMIGRYKDLVAAADEKAIGDFERERAYQDTRADKAKAEEKAERAYQDAKAKEQREIEKQRMEYIDKKLEKLQGPAFRAATETAKANVANEARNLDPERFAGKSDEEILERLRLGVEPQKKSGLSFEEQKELKELEYGLKEKLEKIKKETKLAETAAKNEGKMSKPAEKIMQKEADNIGKEADKLQEEHRKVQSLNASYVKNINRLNTFKKDIEKLDELVNTAGHLIGVGIRAKGKNDPKAVKAYQEIRGLMTRVNTGMIEFAKEAGATGKMLDSDKDKETFLGPMAKLDNNIDSIFTTENDVKNTIRTAVKSYEEKLRDYKVLISEMNRNYNDNEDHLNSMKANFDTKYGLNKDKPIKNGTTKTAAGFKITIK